METLRVVSVAGMVNNTSGSSSCSNMEGKGKFYYDYDSACSTPYVSAPSSPGRPGAGFFFSAPTSPMHPLVSRRAEHNFLANTTADGISKVEDDEASVSTGSDFEFSARFSELDGADSMSTEPTMSSADELFCNGQIRPLKLSTHLQKPQFLGPLIDFEEEEEESKAGSSFAVAEPVGERGRDRLCRDKSHRRRTRSLSPLRSSAQWVEEEHSKLEDEEAGDADEKSKNIASSSSSSSSSTKRRGSKRWSLKDLLLYRSKSEGRDHTRERHWALSFASPAKQSSEKPKIPKQSEKPKPAAAKKINAIPSSNPTKGPARRGPPVSAHELHYTANRAQAEELRRKTYLPYRQGLLGCLGFPSKSYTTMNGFAKTLHPLSS